MEEQKKSSGTGAKYVKLSEMQIIVCGQGSISGVPFKAEVRK